MDKYSVKSKLVIEFLGIAITAILVFFILYPVYQHIQNSYPLLYQNLLQLVIFFTVTRYIFFWRFNLIARYQYVKVALVVLMIPMIFLVIGMLNNFQTYVGEVGLEKHFQHLENMHSLQMQKYLRNESLLFGVGSIIATVTMFVRVAISVWRQHNRGTV